MTTSDQPQAVPSRRGDQQRWFVIGVLALAVAFMVYQQVMSNLSRNDAVDTARSLAEPVNKLCHDDPTARRQIGDESCDQAAEVQQNPSVVALPPRDGHDGEPGRGIRSTAIDAAGHLIVTFTDGTREDEGVVVGATGEVGPNGRGISSSTLDDAGQLVLTFTDGVTDVVGRVVGADGVDGDDGKPGRGVARTVAHDGRLVVYYDDAPDVPVDVGPLPVGPPGPAGRGITTLDLNLTACTVKIYYDDGTSEVKPVTGCESPPPTSEPPATTSSLPLLGG
jgi:hypothetical protein